jgi:hypothetical protein
MFPVPRLLLFINYTWSYRIKKLHLERTVYSYILNYFWNKFLSFPKTMNQVSFSWTGGFLWSRNWSFIYTGCPRRNVPNLGRVFLMLKYTNITQNTYIQSWTVTEIITREKWGFLAVPNTATRTADHHVTQLMSLRLECWIEQYACLYQNSQSAKFNQYFHTAGYACAV